MEYKMTFTEKIENYWYHYKWPTIIGAFFIIVIAICTVQCATNKDADAMIMYAGNYAVPDDYKERSLEGIMKKDYNGDGEKRVDVFQLVLNVVEKSGEYEYYDAVGQNEELQRLEIEFYTGQSVIYILHPYIYEQYRNVMMPLSEILGEVPDGVAYDDRAIKLSELPSYSETTLGFYPEECVLCIRNKRTQDNLVSRKDRDEYYEANKRFFCDIVMFSADATVNS